MRERVEELESELARARTAAPKGSEELSQGEEKHTFHFSFRSLAANEVTRRDCFATFETTWDVIFGAVAPLMINELSETSLKKALDTLVLECNVDWVLMEKKLKDATLSGFKLESDDFQTIKIQLRALGLIAKSEKVRSLKDTQTYWTLTPYGDEVMTRLRAIKRSATSAGRRKWVTTDYTWREGKGEGKGVTTDYT